MLLILFCQQYVSTASTRASVLKEPGVRESDRKSYDVYGTCNTVVAKQEGVWESFAGQKIRSLVLDDQCVCWWEFITRSKQRKLYKQMCGCVFNFRLWLGHREFMREWWERTSEKGTQGQIEVMGFKGLWRAVKQEGVYDLILCCRKTVLVAVWKKDWKVLRLKGR